MKYKFLHKGCQGPFAGAHPEKPVYVQLPGEKNCRQQSLARGKKMFGDFTRGKDIFFFGKKSSMANLKGSFHRCGQAKRKQLKHDDGEVSVEESETLKKHRRQDNVQRTINVVLAK